VFIVKTVTKQPVHFLCLCNGSIVIFLKILCLCYGSDVTDTLSCEYRIFFENSGKISKWLIMDYQDPGGKELIHEKN
jgi:hypothetical protein